MRICVIGPSGSGKSSLATDLSKLYSVPVFNLDYIFYERSDDGSRRPVEDDKLERTLSDLIDRKDWIIEGIYSVVPVLSSADWIIYLKPGLHACLFRQWKRFLTDPKQRSEYGLINNLFLSKYIIKQHLLNENPLKSEGIRYVRVRKMERILNGFKFKLITLRSSEEVDRFLKNLESKSLPSVI